MGPDDALNNDQIPGMGWGKGKRGEGRGIEGGKEGEDRLVDDARVTS